MRIFVLEFKKIFYPLKDIELHQIDIKFIYNFKLKCVRRLTSSANNRKIAADIFDVAHVLLNRLSLDKIKINRLCTLYPDQNDEINETNQF